MILRSWPSSERKQICAKEVIGESIMPGHAMIAAKKTPSVPKKNFPGSFASARR